MKVKKNEKMRPEYDFGPGVRGKYAKKYAEGVNLVLLDPDVSESFPDSRSVNHALRLLAEIAKRSEKQLPGA